MTKYNILAVVIPVLLAVSTTNATEIYNNNGNKLEFHGRVASERNFTTSNQHRNNDSSYGQIGLKGETQINEQVTGYGKWEYHAKAEDEQGDPARLKFGGIAGIKFTNIGSIDYGRNYGIVYDVESYTDKSPSFSGETWVGSYSENHMAGRSTGLVTYRNNNFFGLVDALRFGIQYQIKNDHSNLKKANGDGIGVSLGYDFGEGFGLVGAYSSANRTINQKIDRKGNKAESWAVGAKYDADNIYLATVYAETHNMSSLGERSNTLLLSPVSNTYNVANKTQNFEAIAQYQLDFGLRPSLSYVQSKGKDLDDVRERDLAKYISAGATYSFNKNFNIYSDYRISLLNKKDASTSWVGPDNQATIGMAYQF